MSKSTKTHLAAALSAAFLATSVAPIASADVNPFSATQLNSGYDLANYGAHEGSCGGDKADKEGQCGGHSGEGKAHKEGSCGGDKAAKEGSCGGDKAEAKAGKEGKCGEGKCGG
jgi:uncharacterized low-complexity protein